VYSGVKSKLLFQHPDTLYNKPSKRLSVNKTTDEDLLMIVMTED